MKNLFIIIALAFALNAAGTKIASASELPMPPACKKFERPEAVYDLVNWTLVFKEWRCVCLSGRCSRSGEDLQDGGSGDGGSGGGESGGGEAGGGESGGGEGGGGEGGGGESGGGESGGGCH